MRVRVRRLRIVSRQVADGEGARWMDERMDGWITRGVSLRGLLVSLSARGAFVYVESGLDSASSFGEFLPSLAVALVSEDVSRQRTLGFFPRSLW